MPVRDFIVPVRNLKVPVRDLIVPYRDLKVPVWDLISIFKNNNRLFINKTGPDFICTNHLKRVAMEPFIKPNLVTVKRRRDQIPSFAKTQVKGVLKTCAFVP